MLCFIETVKTLQAFLAFLIHVCSLNFPAFNDLDGYVKKINHKQRIEFLQLIMIVYLLCLEITRAASFWSSSIWQKMTYLAGSTSASNSAVRWRLIMFLLAGIPRAVAIVSPLNDGSKTTKPPCTPLSVGQNRQKCKILISEMLVTGCLCLITA